MKDFYPTVLGSATAGLISRAICHPIDTVKSRLQAGQPGLRSLEHIGALYRGIGAVLVGGVPGVCIYMTTYEVNKRILNEMMMISEIFTEIQKQNEANQSERLWIIKCVEKL
jgi:hypothetical protein